MLPGKTVFIEGGMDAAMVYAVLKNVSSCFLPRWKGIQGNHATVVLREAETAIYFMP